MRRGVLFVLAASLGVTLACSDQSPTSPTLEATAAASPSTDSPALQTAARPRHVVVVPARADALPPGVWGSDAASLTIRDNGATLQILSSSFLGGCYGKYGDMSRKIPNGPFSFAGTFTQLIGAYPGKIEYAAQYSGVVDGNTLSITVTVPALQQGFGSSVLGPFVLVRGVSNAWTPCLYP